MPIVMDKRLTDKIVRYFATQPIVKAWVFGSYARGEAHDGSDIDILVVFDKDAKVSLMKHAMISLELSELLGFDVDLITEGTLLSFAERTANNDKILIYEREQVRDRGRLEHILQAIDKVFEFTKDVKREDFKKDSILYFAIVKNIEIIGEASYMLSLDFKDAHPNTNWKVIVAMRHFLVHGYYQVDPDEVWNVIEQDLQPLKEQIEKYLADM